MFITPPPQPAGPAPDYSREEHQVQESVIGESQEPTLPALELPQIAIQISQHSSFPRDQYILYQSSQSAQGLSSSQLLHQDSGLGESSPPPELLVPTTFGEDGIVPDSQAVPDSSSYVPTSSKSVDISAAAEIAVIDSGRSPLPTITPIVLEPSNASVAELSGQIEDPTNSTTPHKVEFKLASQRSTSTPVQQLIKDSPSSVPRVSQAIESTTFSRAHSDPGPVAQHGQETRQYTLEPSTASTASQTKSSQAGQVIFGHPTVVESPSLDSASNPAVEDSSPVVEVTGSVIHHSPEKASDIDSSGQELVLQTQVPLLLYTQISDQVYTPISTIG